MSRMNLGRWNSSMRGGSFKTGAAVANGIGSAGFKAGGAVLKSPLLGMGVIGMGVAAATYDGSSGVSFSSHMAEEGAKLAVDVPVDLALFGLGEAIGAGIVGGSAGGVLGMVLGGAASVGMYALGVNPGKYVGESIEAARESYREERFGRRPITQNRRTMQAMQKSMQMLGQSSPTSMLGKEASFMHN